jgi:hypothetical protein
MKSTEVQVMPAPPNLIKAILSGFDSTANHIALILFPVALDVFLWLGPHLRVKGLMENAILKITSLPGLATPETADMLKLSREYWLAAALRVNLFSALRSFPVGIPSLMVSRQPVLTPFGAPPFWEVSSLGVAALIWISLTIVGMVLGSLFFMLVGQVTQGERLVDWRQTFSAWPRASLQVILLTLFWLAVLVAISIPASCALTLVTFAGLGGSTLGVILYFGLVLWVIFPLIFSPLGILADQRKVWPAVVDSFRLTRFTLPTTGLLFIILIVISEGMDFLWNVPAESSWITLLAVGGHAFIATSLLATYFIYYRDASRWRQRVIQQAKLSSIA